MVGHSVRRSDHGHESVLKAWKWAMVKRSRAAPSLSYVFSFNPPTPMRYLLAALVLIGLLPFPIPQAHACSCMPISAQERIDLAESSMEK